MIPRSTGRIGLRPALVARAILIAIVPALAGCINLAPDYRRPDAPVAPSWADRGAGDALPAAGSVAAASAGTLAWDAFIADERLRAVVGRALRNNRDLRIAVLNVERARAVYRIREAARLPALQGSASGTRTRTDGFTSSSYTAAIDASYEVDLFGRLRNLSDASLASFFATREARRSAQVLLVSEVATVWLTLAADEQRLAVSRQTLDSQQRSLDLAVRIRDLGATTGLALAQVRSTVEAARVQSASLQTQIALDRNALELLIGGPLDDGLAPDARIPEAGALFDVPRELPSSVLIERPDVQAAERDLQATYANIGAARAAYFPRITLTGAAGNSSVALNQLFKNGSGFFSFSPSISLPIFSGGLNDANLAAARVDREVAIAAYERSLQSAFREVADVLAARGTLAERTAGQRALIDAVETSYRLSDAVFRQGGSSYLQVLEAERSLYGARQSLIGLLLEEQTTRVGLYKALGGGWNQGNNAP